MSPVGVICRIAVLYAADLMVLSECDLLPVIEAIWKRDFLFMILFQDRWAIAVMDALAEGYETILAAMQ
jgi:hypothetical protein